MIYGNLLIVGSIIWFIAALVLGGLELAAGEFTFLMLAGGAAAGGVVAALGAPLWGAVLAFAVASIALILFLRPYLKRHLQGPKALDTSSKALIGSSAEVLEIVGADYGQVRLGGDIWSAKSLDPEKEFQPGERVQVINVDGPTVVVWRD